MYFLEHSLIKVTSFPFKFVGSSNLLGGGGSGTFRSLKFGLSDVMFSALDEICIPDHLYG